MSDPSLQDAALIVVAHGSTKNAGSGAPALQHAAELRHRGIFAEVTEAFLQQEPSLHLALDRVRAARVFVVPLFISEGWFSEHVVPRQLGLRTAAGDDFDRVQNFGGRTVHYCKVVGTHPAMTQVLLERARQIVVRHPTSQIPEPSRTALLIAGHGTPYSRGSRAAIDRQVELLRISGPYVEVHGVFLEEQPRIQESWSLTRVRNLVLVPFFISDGMHTQEDIPRLLGEPAKTIHARLRTGDSPWRNPTRRHGKRLWYTAAVGTEPLVADVIVQRVHEAALMARSEVI